MKVTLVNTRHFFYKYSDYLPKQPKINEKKNFSKIKRTEVQRFYFKVTEKKTFFFTYRKNTRFLITNQIINISMVIKKLSIESELPEF